MKKAGRQTGFTLIELMVTLTIAGILLAIGVPSFNAFIKNSSLTTGVNELVGALNLARSEAVKRGSRVTVCKSANQTSCTNSNGWEQGWIIFTDENNNAAYNPTGTPPETLIRVHAALNSAITATSSAPVSNYVSYIASGRSQQTGGGSQSGNIRLCDDRSGNIGKNLAISLSGRVRATSGASCP